MSDKYLIVGLGNPGKQYEATRHNIGFMVLEALSRRAGIVGKSESRFKAVVGLGRLGSYPVILAQPLTYMNLSGEAVLKLMNYYDVPPERLLVIYDEAALPFGKIRVRPAGSDAGQKGVRSIIQQLGGNQQFARLRVGIGSPPPPMAMPDFVLSKFAPEEQKHLPEIIDAALDAVEAWMSVGVEETMTRYNGRLLLPQ
ncbi:aminoacyl-tRNA hydrolase [Vampirovibrio chlorellavorus]|uniref:aminoacyl-tRNA hydrolase n=1 Tax=Vampirovibrio chlorellavorus TaxID=758823 RepID=UPI0026F07C99|nr:aminoacyl-tRNA hydrolase [Vampirovibrio chlorellavorus]